MKSLVVFLILLCPYLAQGQIDSTAINQTDEKGLRQGLWGEKTHFSIDSVHYKDGKREGVLRRYTKSGSLWVIMNFRAGEVVGTTQSFRGGRLYTEELDRGTNTETVQHDELNYKLTPPKYSYVKLYDHKEGYLKAEGKYLYSEDWQMDTSRRHGKWLFYNEKGQVIETRVYHYGRVQEPK